MGIQKAMGLMILSQVLAFHASAAISKKANIPMPDSIIFEEILRAYQHGQIAKVSQKTEILLENMPQSVYADNALYLKGLMQLSENNFVGALASFEKVIRDYPKSNKAVSALFAKGVAYKKMSLVPQARAVLNQVKKSYPGSSESFRTDAELKLLEKKVAKKN